MTDSEHTAPSDVENEALIDEWEEEAMKRFLSKTTDSRDGIMSPYDLSAASSDYLRTLSVSPYRVLEVLMTLGNVEPSDLDGYTKAVGEFETFDDYLLHLNSDLLGAHLENTFPELAEEERRRFSLMESGPSGHIH